MASPEKVLEKQLDDIRIIAGTLCYRLKVLYEKYSRDLVMTPELEIYAIAYHA